MKLSWSTQVVAVVGMVALASACGGGAESDTAAAAQNRVVPVQTNYVTIVPATTTTTTTTLPQVAGQISAERTHTVVSGDSAFGIAAKYGVDVNEFVRYNNFPAGIDHTFQVGDVVKIPPSATNPGTQTAAAPGGETASGGTNAPAAGEGCEHTIVKNENPSKVAKKYNVTLDAFMAANADNPAVKTFLVGAKVKIPPGGSC